MPARDRPQPSAPPRKTTSFRGLPCGERRGSARGRKAPSQGRSSCRPPGRRRIPARYGRARVIWRSLRGHDRPDRAACGHPNSQAGCTVMAENNDGGERPPRAKSNTDRPYKPPEQKSRKDPLPRGVVEAPRAQPQPSPAPTPSPGGGGGRAPRPPQPPGPPGPPKAPQPPGPGDPKKPAPDFNKKAEKRLQQEFKERSRGKAIDEAERSRGKSR